MNIQELLKKFSDEKSCKSHFKSEKDKQGVVYNRCTGINHYWISTVNNVALALFYLATLYYMIYKLLYYYRCFFIMLSLVLKRVFQH